MSTPIIRDAVWPQDKAAAISFIDGLQAYEHRFEPNRRIDAQAGADYINVLLANMTKNSGIARIAEIGGEVVGWTVAWPETDDVYVIPEEFHLVYIAELFVVENARGSGIGRALIASCEDFARSLGIHIVKIGVLPKNTRAATIYARAGYEPYALQLRKYLR